MHSWKRTTKKHGEHGKKSQKSQKTAFQAREHGFFFIIGQSMDGAGDTTTSPIRR